MDRLWGILSRGLGILVVVCLASAAPAEGTVQSPVLTIDSERLFEESNFGRATAREFEMLGAELARENRRIEEELTVEEKSLTEQRTNLPAADFRVLADAFDQKVQSIRRQQDVKTRQLNAALDERRGMFLTAAAPVLEQIMRDAGAAVILEQRSVFVSSNAVDITQSAIARLNAVLQEPIPSEKPEQ